MEIVKKSEHPYMTGLLTIYSDLLRDGITVGPYHLRVLCTDKSEHKVILQGRNFTCTMRESMDSIVCNKVVEKDACEFLKHLNVMFSDCNERHLSNVSRFVSEEIDRALERIG